MRGDDGHSLSRRAQRQPARDCASLRLSSGSKIERVVDEQQVALLSARLVEGGVVHLKGDKYSAHLVAK